MAYRRYRFRGRRRITRRRYGGTIRRVRRPRTLRVFVRRRRY